MWFWSKRNVLLFEHQAAKALKCPPGFLKIPPTPKCLTYPGGYYRPYNIQYHQPSSTYSNKYLRCFIHGLWPDAFPGLHLASTLRIPSAGDEGLVLGMKGNETDGPTEKYDKETENARGWKLCNNCCSVQSPFPLNPRFSVLQNDYSWLYTTMMEGLLEASGRNRGPAKSWWDLASIITDAMRLWAFIGWLIYVDMWHSIPEIPREWNLPPFLHSLSICCAFHPVELHPERYRQRIVQVLAGHSATVNTVCQELGVFWSSLRETLARVNGKLREFLWFQNVSNLFKPVFYFPLPTFCW